MKVISNVENAQSRNGVWPRSVCMMGKSSHFLLCIMCGDWVHKNCRGMTSSHTIVNHLIQCVQWEPYIIIIIIRGEDQCYRKWWSVVHWTFFLSGKYDKSKELWVQERNWRFNLFITVRGHVYASCMLWMRDAAVRDGPTRQELRSRCGIQIISEVTRIGRLYWFDHLVTE